MGNQFVGGHCGRGGGHGEVGDIKYGFGIVLVVLWIT